MEAGVTMGAAYATKEPTDSAFAHYGRLVEDLASAINAIEDRLVAVLGSQPLEPGRLSEVDAVGSPIKVQNGRLASEIARLNDIGRRIEL